MTAPAPSAKGLEAHDPFVEAELERALQPYRALLSTEALEAMRESLRDLLSSHPSLSTLVRRARPLPSVDASGDFAVQHPADPTLPRDGKKGR